MYCQEDKVALDAVKFLTMFPQRLSPALVHAGEVITLRQSILSQSMHELEDIRNKSVGSDYLTSNLQLNTRLKRTLMLLNSLLDESSADSSKRIKSHSGKWKSKPITIKIQYGKVNGVTLHFDSNDTIEDLIHGISKYLNKEPKLLKFFRRGNELTMNNLIRRTLQQIDLLMNETIVVVDRPVTTIQNYTINNTYLCPFESLPAYILSNKPEYLEILFSLLEMTSGSICNDIWELIIRLPTSPNAYNIWKHMITNTLVDSNENTILNLFSINTNDTIDESQKQELDGYDNNTNGKRVKIPKSLSRLIYNLQIIENFLHSNNKKVVEDLDETVEEDEDLWIGMFIAYGGIRALEDAFEYIIEQFIQYCQFSNNITHNKYISNSYDENENENHKSNNNNNNELYGITSKLLLYAINSITKIFRAIIIRGALCGCPNNLQEVIFLVTSSQKVTIFDNKSVEIQNDGIKDKSIISSILNYKKVLKNNQSNIELSENELLETKLNSIEDREEFLLGEWGNRFNIPFDVANSSSSDLINSTVNLFHIQHSIYKFLLTIPKFSLESIFYQESNQNLNLLSVRDIIHGMQNDFLQSLQNILIIWGSVIILQPQIINYLIYNNNNNELLKVNTIDNINSNQNLSAKDLLITLLMKFPSVDLTITNTTDILNQYSAIVSESCVSGLLILLKVSESCTINKSDYYLRNLFLQIILDQRPHLKLFQKVDDKILDNKDSFFIFATYLLHFENQEKVINLSDEKVIQISQDIYNEMVTIYGSSNQIKNQSHGCSGKYYSFLTIQYFSGTMKLLQYLLQKNQSAVNILLKQGIIEYLIEICLGVQSLRSISLNILCNDSESR